ncbi:sporulation membrane protein YtaF [Virgibacillus flavescens]|uniref:sporulation membrane protein YtaF n=1 Tax=Virgibacillus flavescens TaxID=1611422 RepID=UPI003D3344C2
MFFYMGLFLLVIAVSLDGFGVGITYGMRRIRVPFVALAIIMLCSGIIVLISMTIGMHLSSYISPGIAEGLGGAILIAIGLYCLVNVVRTKISEQTYKQDHHKIIEANRIKKYGSVLSKPQHADLDQSGSISTSEALLLGSALALDAFGAGLGAAMLGYAPLFTAGLIAFMSGLFVYTGLIAGELLAQNKSLYQVTLLSPFFLIVLGIINLL